MAAQARTPTTLYLWVWGVALVVLGVGSLVVHPDFAVGDRVTDEHLFGVFETNGWHGLAGGALGVLALFSAAADRWTREVALVVAGLGGILPAFVFLASGDGSVALGLIPVDFADAITLHLIPGIIGVIAVAVDQRDRPPAPSPSDLRAGS